MKKVDPTFCYYFNSILLYQSFNSFFRGPVSEIQDDNLFFVEKSGSKNAGKLFLQTITTHQIKLADPSRK